MRLLILSCNTGEGHNSAARALKECFEKQGHICEIKDALAFWSPEKSKLISKGHIFIYRKMPKLFGVSYRFEENHPPKNGSESLMYELVIRGCEELDGYLSSADFDAVICTHVFSAMMMTELKKRRKCSLKSYFIATDYTCSPGVGQTSMDAYFIPHRALISEFVQNGIPQTRIVPSGIPVRSDFYQHTDKAEAKKALSLDKYGKAVLLMCGSMGCGPIKTLSEYLPQQLPSDAVLVVICGSNVKLYKSLTKHSQPENVRIVGFTKRMPLYMDAADLILTKPGGLSSTEAAVKALPMIFIDAVPGCETRNYEFFLKNGCADMPETEMQICDDVCDCLENPERLKEMSDTLNREFTGHAAVSICDYILKDVDLAYGRL